MCGIQAKINKASGSIMDSGGRCGMHGDVEGPLRSRGGYCIFYV